MSLDIPKLNEVHPNDNKNEEVLLELPKMVDIPKLKDDSVDKTLELPKLTSEKTIQKNLNKKRTIKKNN